MTPTTSKGFDDKLAGLLASMAVANEGMINLMKLSEKHENVLYGTDDTGGLVTHNSVLKQTVEEHTDTLDKLEKSCTQVVAFMEGQVKINDSIDHALQNMNKVILSLGGVVFLILILIGVADISALHNLLGGIHIP